MQVGDKISFGQYIWRILDVKEDRALLITEEIIDQREYHNRKEAVTWANSEIRSYLNSAFLDRFCDEDKSKIIPVLHENKGNAWYPSDGGEETIDLIFLLSLDEAVRLYFGDSSKCLVNRSPKQRYWFQKKDENNPLRRASYDGCSWWWWLRTPGRDNRRAIYIHGDGNIGIQGNGTYKYSSNTIHPISKKNEGGLRPAVWIKTKF